MTRPMPRSIASFTASLLLFAGSAFAQVTPPQIPQGVTPPIVGLTAFIDGGGNLPSPIYGPLSCTAPAYSYQGLTAYGWGLSGTTLCAVVNATSVLSISATAVTSTVPIALGTNPATAGGGVRLGNNTSITARNSENSADYTIFNFDTAENVNIGDATVTAVQVVNPTLRILSDSAALTLGASSDVSVSRAAANIFSLAAGDSYQAVGVAFASLGTPANGTFTYCTDCAKATPCSGSSTGAFAVRINGAWDCNP